MAKIYQSLPKEILSVKFKDFKRPSFKEREANRQDQSAELALSLERLRVKDIKWRVRRRGFVTYIAYLLLFIQNFGVGYLIWLPIHQNRQMSLAYYQLMTVLIGATLTESAYIIRMIVQWLFKEVSYAKYNGDGRDNQN